MYIGFGGDAQVAVAGVGWDLAAGDCERWIFVFAAGCFCIILLYECKIM